MGRMFGTDGVRGVAGKELTIDLAMKLGQAGAYVLSKNTNEKPNILVGCDSRISGDMLSNALMAGICSVGANVVFAGVLPTPAIAYITKAKGFNAGVVISASHNPMEFNGIKFFSNKGYKLPDEIEDEIQSYIENNMKGIEFPIGEKVGSIKYDFDILRYYIDFEKKTVPIDLSGLKIVVDCANGASSYTNRTVLEELGANLIPINVTPMGTNINKNCGSTHMNQLIETVKKEKADIGIAFDGDADRMLAVDEKGEMVCGDEVMAICALHMKEKGRLKKNTLVVTVMSNLGLSIMCKEKGISVEVTKVGDRYVLERMMKGGFNIGGEQSGHIIFLDDNTTGDGMMSALNLLKVMTEEKKPLSKLKSIMTILPQYLVNAKVSNDKKNSYLNDSEIKKRINALEDKFKGNGRVLIRPSGTEPLVRVMIEGKDQKEIEKDAKELADFIEKRLA